MTTSKQSFEREIERNYRHNYLVNVLDGTFFWGGSSLIASATILPVYVSYFTDSRLAIGLLSMIGTTGWLLPQLLTANWVQRLPRKKVLPVNIGLFTERLPVVLLALSALLAARFPTLALPAFFVCYAWHVVGAGVVAVAWQDMIGKIIPANRRGKFFGLANFLGTATGLAGASVAAWLLDRYGFPAGYVWCFALAAISLLISWSFLALTREPALESDRAPVSQREYWRRLPSIVRADPNFRNYLFSQVVIAVGGMAGGFLTVYALQRWRLPDGQAGVYTAIMLLGQAVSNLLFGPLADRKGHKLVLELGTLLGGLGIGLAALAPSSSWFYVVFLLLGANWAGFLLSGLMIALEFCPAELRPTYIGLNNTVRGVAYGLAPIFGGWLAETVGYRPLFAVASAVGLSGLALLHWSVREPRQAKAAASLLKASNARPRFRTAGVARSAIAIVVTLTFWGAVAYTFWPEILPSLLRIVGTVRGVGAKEVESVYFEVRDTSSADGAEVRRLVGALEADYAAIHEFLGRQPGYRVPVLIANGSGPALTDGVRLNVFYDHGATNLSTAPFFLVLLTEGELSLPGMSAFVEGGFAVYVAEEIGRAQELIGQSSDTWVTLFLRDGTLLPLADAWAVELPDGEEGLLDFLRATLEGGSFVRWMADSYGIAAVEDLRNGLGLEDVSGLSPADAERAWLASVTSRSLRPQPCAQAVPQSSPLYGFCGQLDGDPGKLH